MTVSNQTAAFDYLPKYRKALEEVIASGRIPVTASNSHRYQAIASYFFCPPTFHEYLFLQHYLGHVMESPATGHYFHYRLVDEQGKFGIVSRYWH